MLVTLFSLLLSANVAYAQSSQPPPTASTPAEPTEVAETPVFFKCGTDDFPEIKAEPNPAPRATAQSAQPPRKSAQQAGAASTTASKGDPTPPIIYIPVVFHILQSSDPTNPAFATITVTQVQDQIDALNRDFMATNYDYSKIRSTYFSSMYGKTNSRIQFFLARRDINNRPLNGPGSNRFTARSPGQPVIAGVEWDGTSLDFYDYQVSGLTNPRDPATGLPSLPNWPPSDYLNIWVCNINAPRSGSTLTLGNGTLPIAPVLGSWQDGIVMHTTAFGVSGNNRGPLVRQLGHSLSHEVGHWLGLHHLWGAYADNAQCAYDDGIADTPMQNGPSEPELYQQTGAYGRCPNPAFPIQVPATCNNNSRGGNMYMSFMDYAPEDCNYMFSTGQAARMRETILGPNAPRASLLNSLGMAPQSVSIDAFGANAALCAGSQTRFAVQALFPGGPPCGGTLSYQWTVPPGWGINLATNATPTITPNGSSSGSIGLTVTYQNGTRSVTLTAPPLVLNAPVPVFTGVGDMCFASRRAFSVQPIPGAASYHWQAPAGFTIMGAPNGATSYVTTDPYIYLVTTSPAIVPSTSTYYTVGVNTNLAGACATTPKATNSFRVLPVAGVITTSPAPVSNQLCANTPVIAQVSLSGQCSQGVVSNFSWSLGLDHYAPGDPAPIVTPSSNSQFSFRTGNSGHTIVVRASFDYTINGYTTRVSAPDLSFVTARVINGNNCPPDIYTRPAANPPVVYPNPATGMVTAERLNGAVHIYNSQGRRVYQTTATIGGPITMDLRHLPTGLYQVVGQDAEGRPTRQQLQLQP